MLTLLHMLPPELAHKLTLLGLRLGLAPNQPVRGLNRLFGKTIGGYVGLSGGADKNAEALAGWRRIGFSFVEVGTVTLAARAGNPSPRIWRQEAQCSLVNWMGLPNLGAQAVAKNLAAFRRSAGGEDFCVGVSLASPSSMADELRQMAQLLAPYADFFTLNASCPNVSGHNAHSALEGIGAQLRATIEGAGSKPVLVKLAPTRDEQSLRQTVRYLKEAGAAGFIACNTLPSGSASLADASLLPESWPRHNGEPVGGYSGKALFAISTSMVRIIRSEVGEASVIIGVGGIDSPQAAQQMLECGANAVQLYTALTYQGVPLIKKLNAELEIRN